MASFAVTAGCFTLLLCFAGMAHAQETNSTDSMGGPDDDYEQPIVPISPGVSFNGTSAVTRANSNKTPYNSGYLANGTLNETDFAAIKTNALDAMLGGDFTYSPCANCILLSFLHRPCICLSAHHGMCLRRCFCSRQWGWPVCCSRAHHSPDIQWSKAVWTPLVLAATWSHQTRSAFCSCASRY